VSLIRFVFISPDTVEQLEMLWIMVITSTTDHLQLLIETMTGECRKFLCFANFLL